MEFKGKAVWITGASAGIGAELARVFASKGAKVALTARSETKLKSVKDSLTGDGHAIFTADLMDASSINPLADKVMEWCQGKLFVLVNNAGRSQRSLIKDTSLDVDRAIMELDYFAHVAVTKAVLPYMTRENKGNIVSISSIAGKVGTPMRSAYNGAKFAIAGFMDSVRAEYHENNVEVLNIFPGSIKTDISVNASSGDGSSHGVVDPAIAKGLTVEYCANKIVSSIEARKKEVVIARFKEKLITYIRRLSPSLAFKIVSKLKTT